MIRVCTIFSFILVFAAQVHASVWEATATWNDAYEAKYSRWIESSFDESFFLRGDWAGIRTDCADAVYGSRLIFSYLNGLPFDLSLTDARFSNTSKAFDHIADPVLRVREFLDFVNDKTWTGALAKHTYPVALVRSEIKPGTIWLKPGHVETVRHVRPTGVVELRGSWLPGAIRKMITITVLGHVPQKTVHGFRRWIWPQNLGRPLREQPGFSEMQFSLGSDSEISTASVASAPGSATALDQYLVIARFESKVQKALGKNVESPGARATRMAHDFCALLESRAEVVGAGYDYVSALPRCLNETEYHAYSTPSRDSNLRRVAFGLGLQLKNNLSRIAAVLEKCPPVRITEFEKITPFEFLKKLLKIEYSSNPHERPAVRFGLAPSDGVCIKDGTDEE